MRSTRTSRRRCSRALVLALVVLTACGGDDDTTSATTTAPATDTRVVARIKAVGIDDRFIVVTSGASAQLQQLEVAPDVVVTVIGMAIDGDPDSDVVPWGTDFQAYLAQPGGTDAVYWLTLDGNVVVRIDEQPA